MMNACRQKASRLRQRPPRIRQFLQRPRLTSSVEIVHHPFLPVEIPEDSPFVKGVKGAFEAVTGKLPRIESTPYSSDLWNLVYDAGMEAITF